MKAVKQVVFLTRLCHSHRWIYPHFLLSRTKKRFVSIMILSGNGASHSLKCGGTSLTGYFNTQTKNPLFTYFGVVILPAHVQSSLHVRNIYFKNYFHSNFLQCSEFFFRHWNFTSHVLKKFNTGYYFHFLYCMLCKQIYFSLLSLPL